MRDAPESRMRAAIQSESTRQPVMRTAPAAAIRLYRRLVTLAVSPTVAKSAKRHMNPYGYVFARR